MSVNEYDWQYLHAVKVRLYTSIAQHETFDIECSRYIMAKIVITTYIEREYPYV